MRSSSEIEIGLDHLQDVVEVMRHATGQLADGLHLLSLAQCRLVAQFLRDVDAPYDRAAVRHVAARDLILLPIMGDPRRQRSADGALLELERRQQRSHGRPLTRQQPIARRQWLFRRIPSGQPDERPVPRHDDPLGIEHEDRVLQCLQGRLQELRSCRELALRIFQPTGAAHDDVHAGNEADEGAAEDQQAGGIRLLLLGAQHAEPSCELQLLAFDERLGDLADVVGGGAPRALVEGGFAAIELEGHDGRIELIELVTCRDPEFGDLPAGIGVAGGGGLELADEGVDAQSCPLVGL